MKARISDALVQALKPSGKDFVQYEPGGFGVRVTPAGTKLYVFQTRLKGRPVRFAVGPASELSITEARRKADKLRGQVADGVDPREAKRQTRREGTTLREYWDDYLVSARLRLKPITLRGYEAIMTKHVLPRLGHRSVASIKRPDAKELHTAILAQGTDKRDNLRTANKAVQTLRLLLTEAEGHLIPIGSNELKGMRLPGDRQRKRFLRDEDVAALEGAFGALRGKGVSAMAEAFLRTMLLTGARGGELQALEWAHVDTERKLGIIPVGKNGEPRVIPLAGAWEIIDALPRAGRLVFWGRNPELPYVKFRHVWRLLRAKAGLGEDIKPHDLRHSFASAVLAQNYALPVVGALLGHKSVASTKRYSHLAETAANAVAADAASAIKAAAQGKRSLGTVRRVQQ